MKIAVLIPCFNVERYVAECLDSVLIAGARLSSSALSIFCLDDGSRDGTLDILRDYSQSHPEIHCAAQPNAGVSATRNRLLDELPPEFDAFAFVDADDTVEPNIYADLSAALESTSSDVAECEWFGEQQVIDDMSVFLLRKTAPGLWIPLFNKLYRRSAVGHIRLRENLAHEEDFYYCFEVNQACKRKVLVPVHGYNYRNNPDGVCNRLNFRKYVTSACERVRLSAEEWLAAGKIPKALERGFARELMSDAFRMCIRKNLKKNPDPVHRRELYEYAVERLRHLVPHPAFPEFLFFRNYYLARMLIFFT